MAWACLLAYCLTRCNQACGRTRQAWVVRAACSRAGWLQGLYPFAQVLACGCGVAALAPHINGAGQFVNRRSFLEKSSEIVRTKHRCPCVLLNIVVDQVSLKALRHKMVLRCLLHQI